VFDAFNIKKEMHRKKKEEKLERMVKLKQEQK
jgi:hypothetical protein